MLGNDSLQPARILIPKNDIPHKFWMSVEPYCAEISAEDIKVMKPFLCGGSLKFQRVTCSSRNVFSLCLKGNQNIVILGYWEIL